MGSHLLGLANSNQLQYSKHFKMKLPVIIAATVAVALAGPQHLRSYSVGTHLRGRYSGQALRSQGLRTYSNYQNYLTKTPVPFSEPYRLDDPISPGPQFTGNYVGKQLDQVAVLPAAASGLAYMRAYFDKMTSAGRLVSPTWRQFSLAAPESRLRLMLKQPTRLLGPGEVVSCQEALVQHLRWLSRRLTPLATVVLPSSLLSLLSKPLRPERTSTTLPAPLLPRLSLTLPTLLTPPVQSLQRLSLMPPSPPPPLATTLSVQPHPSPTWTPSPLERMRSLPT